MNTCSCRVCVVSRKSLHVIAPDKSKIITAEKKMEENGLSNKRRRTIHLLPLSVFSAGLAAIALCAAISQTYWDFLGLLLIIALASSTVGAVLGFLFGIPRLNRNYAPADDYGRTTKYKPNTNLEDVSDWLTKIIIGVTLTQLTRIPGYLESIADSILLSSDCETMNCHFAKPMIISLVICFLIAGFITGYFYTRLYLPNLFSLLEENSMKEAELSIWREGKRRERRQEDTSSTTAKIISLTEDELGLLKTIKRHHNRYTRQRPLHLREDAALNVLITKGIVTETRNDSNDSVSLTIADDALLHLLNDEM